MASTDGQQKEQQVLESQVQKAREENIRLSGLCKSQKARIVELEKEPHIVAALQEEHKQLNAKLHSSNLKLEGLVNLTLTIVGEVEGLAKSLDRAW